MFYCFSVEEDLLRFDHLQKKYQQEFKIKQEEVGGGKKPFHQFIWGTFGMKYISTNFTNFDTLMTDMFVTDNHASIKT